MAKVKEVPQPNPLENAVTKFKFSLESQEPQISDIMQNLLGVQTAGFQTNAAPEELYTHLEELALQAEGKAREMQHPDFTTFTQMAVGYKAAAENFGTLFKYQKDLSELPPMEASKKV